MPIDRSELYRLPWSRTDNPNGWVEVTDACNLDCPGCFRHKMTGHRPLADVQAEVLAMRRLTNCETIGISGGEPLLYPEIVNLVEFVTRQGMTPAMFSNGLPLTVEFGRYLRKAGLQMLYFHVDSGQQRPGWENADEVGMNRLRQEYCDLVNEIGGIGCGYNITITPKNFAQVPEVIAWSRQNIDRVARISFISFRAMLRGPDIEYRAGDRVLREDELPNTTWNPDDIDVTSDATFETVAARFPDMRPCAFLNGTSRPEAHKFLIVLQVGSRGEVYGTLGSRTMELSQTLHHLFRGTYQNVSSSTLSAGQLVGAAVFDPRTRRTFGRVIKSRLRQPWRLFDPLYVQLTNFQHPFDFADGESDTCDGCLNMMLYNGRLVNSCRFDEYRMFGESVVQVRRTAAPERRP